MSAQSLSLDELEVDRYLTVFEGSTPEDVSHARRLWSSVSLLPPHESRLVSADIHQRLPVSRPPQRATTTITAVSAPEPPSLASARAQERREERRRYEAMAQTRRQILELLQRQREQRLQKELLSTAFKPKIKTEKTPTNTQDREECESDRELVQRLQ